MDMKMQVNMSLFMSSKWKRHERGKLCEAAKDWIQIKLSSFVLKDICDSTSQGLLRIYIFKPGTKFGFERVALKRVLWCCSTCNQSFNTLLLKQRNLKPLIAEVVRKLSTIECWRGDILLGTTQGRRRRRMWSWKGWHFAWGITSR